MPTVPKVNLLIVIVLDGFNRIFTCFYESIEVRLKSLVLLNPKFGKFSKRKFISKLFRNLTCVFKQLTTIDR